jgi:hypothetical protein
MNIFFLDKSPEISAQYHCDKHVIKMILESAQMLSTAVRLNFNEEKYAKKELEKAYKITHQKHPSTLWTAKSLDNWLWLKELAFYLNKEYQFRYSKSINHKSFDVVQNLPIPKIPAIGLTEFPQAMPDKYKNSDPIIAYKNYYIGEKARFCKYTKRAIPDWFNYESRFL